jgi:hypothetical protein
LPRGEKVCQSDFDFAVAAIMGLLYRSIDRLP